MHTKDSLWPSLRNCIQYSELWAMGHLRELALGSSHQLAHINSKELNAEVSSGFSSPLRTRLLCPCQHCCFGRRCVRQSPDRSPQVSVVVLTSSERCVRNFVLSTVMAAQHRITDFFGHTEILNDANK